MIAQLPITRIMIAHRQETINKAEQVYYLEHGQLSLVEPLENVANG